MADDTPKVPRPKRVRKGKEGEKPDKESDEEIAQREMQEAEIARMEKILQGLQEQKVALQNEYDTSQKDQDDMRSKLKEARHAEEDLATALAELENDNADVKKDWERGQDLCAQERLNIKNFTGKLKETNIMLAEADAPVGKRNGLADIKIKFGPSSPVRSLLALSFPTPNECAHSQKSVRGTGASA
jgi:chromosome segregation ATPase